MPEEIKNTGETPNAETKTASETPAETQPVKTAAELEAELNSVRAALKKANNESAERRKRLEEFERSKQGEQTETEKLRAEMDALKAQLAQTSLTAMRNRVAANLGLPAALADRLRGETEEEMTTDAQSILSLIPKAAAAKPMPAMNPGEKPRLTREAIEKMTPEQINKHWDEIQAFLKGM